MQGATAAIVVPVLRLVPTSLPVLVVAWCTGADMVVEQPARHATASRKPSPRFDSVARARTTLTTRETHGPSVILLPMPAKGAENNEPGRAAGRWTGPAGGQEASARSARTAGQARLSSSDHEVHSARVDVGVGAGQKRNCERPQVI